MTPYDYMKSSLKAHSAGLEKCQSMLQQKIDRIAELEEKLKGAGVQWPAKRIAEHGIEIEMLHNDLEAEYCTNKKLIERIAELEADIAKMSKEMGHVCGWREESDGSYWATQCGQAHEFTSDGPLENHYGFCPYCGGILGASR